MRLFLDTEFNGFGGGLISLALVPEDPSLPEFYKELDMREQLHPWVKENVVPHLMLTPIGFSEFQAHLQKYLWQFQDIEIVADWPDDIRYFCECLITGPGLCLNYPNPIRFTLDQTINYDSAVPHNALEDARAIRNCYSAKSA
jgi:hypothetical protein